MAAGANKFNENVFSTNMSNEVCSLTHKVTNKLFLTKNDKKVCFFDKKQKDRVGDRTLF